ncbi:cAMP-binding domain of CRP or a regulatory subunit of cAMP-dependent protein kinases [Chitinophaga sp. CF118]|nr:cAMP-binding domain of CRP or a regulatory subunit of cAMP-dependent protein kinases [Chitinophaga sp. CF118]
MEGDVSKKAYFIEKGCIRLWYNNNGKDITFQFFFENEGVSSFESFNTGQPSLFTMEAIEPCVLQWIHKDDFDAVLREEPLIKEDFYKVIAERQMKYMHHFLSFLKDTPKQRYANLLKEKPHIIKRVPLQYIASYLGITPVSLSRIRKII